MITYNVEGHIFQIVACMIHFYRYQDEEFESQFVNLTFFVLI